MLLLMLFAVVCIELRDLFVLFDKDNDGVISTMEVHTILRSLGQDPAQHHVQQAITQFDKNGAYTKHIQKKVWHTTNRDEVLCNIRTALQYQCLQHV